MSFSAGTFTLVSGNPVVTGTTISSTWANNTLSDIATGLTTCLLKDGTQVVTANIPMATFIFTGLGAGSAAGHSVRWEQLLSANGLKVSVGAALTATGSGQSDALQLTSTVNQVTTAAASTGVKLYAAAVAGDVQMVYNGGANPITVYPQTGATINQLAANIGMILPLNTSCMYFAASTTAWVAVLSA